MRQYLPWILIGLLVFFILLNLNNARVNFFYIVRADMPVAFVIIFSAVLGAFSVHFMRMVKKKKKD